MIVSYFVSVGDVIVLIVSGLVSDIDVVIAVAVDVVVLII